MSAASVSGRVMRPEAIRWLRCATTLAIGLPLAVAMSTRIWLSSGMVSVDWAGRIKTQNSTSSPAVYWLRSVCRVIELQLSDG